LGSEELQNRGKVVQNESQHDGLAEEPVAF